MYELVEEWSDMESLIVSSSRSLKIKVVKGEDGITLEDGWEKFWNDNNFSPYEIYKDIVSPMKFNSPIVFCIVAIGKGCSDDKSIPWADNLELQKDKGIYFSVSQLKNCWSNERMRYKAWSKLVCAAGNTYYDPIKNKINWCKQQWEEHLKINPEAEQFVNRLLEYPTEMMILFDA
ncbi:hypothetical protein M9H77_28413 [Catharanthus roseus]|uniref:Uncharacterized protein n=1 Tax=Catharanthus roseus TaxID=4058 RepID=A0ACC0AFH0_CATRO|nr:hypothetical protein M9H77_28413 [Catharanthus roseus]